MYALLQERVNIVIIGNAGKEGRTDAPCSVELGIDAEQCQDRTRQLESTQQ